MKLAISIWNDFVSNAFDFAENILIVEYDVDQEVCRSRISFENKSYPQRICRLKSLKVDVLICGAVTRSLAEMVKASEIELLPYVTGNIDDVLEAFNSGQLSQSDFTMPGCWPGARRGFGRGCQRGRRCRYRGNRNNQ